jgi:hypothetical protein
MQYKVTRHQKRGFMSIRPPISQRRDFNQWRDFTDTDFIRADRGRRRMTSRP